MDFAGVVRWGPAIVNATGIPKTKFGAAPMITTADGPDGKGGKLQSPVNRYIGIQGRDNQTLGLPGYR